MSDPIGIGVAYGTPALTETPDYVRIDDQDAIHVASGFSVRRGRSYITDKMDAGTGGVAFIDTTGVLDPTNATSLFYPMNPNCPARICLRNPVTDTWHPILTGLTQGCPQQIRVNSVDNRGTIEIADLFSLFARTPIPPGFDYTDNEDGTYSATSNTTGDTKYPESTVQDRIKALLADMSVPSGMTRIFSGNVRLQETVYSLGDMMLTALQEAADAEFPGVANIYIDKLGRVTFHGRLARFDPFGDDYGIHAWDLGDFAAVQADSSKVALTALFLDRDVQKIVNSALFTPQGIAEGDIPGQLVDDATSKGQYGVRDLPGPDLILAGGTSGTTFEGDPKGEAKLYGQYYVGNLKNPQTRVQQAVVKWRNPNNSNAAAHWDFMCNVEINDIVSIFTTHRGGGGFGGDQYYVEGLAYEHGIGPDLTLTLDLSPLAYFDPAHEPEHWDGT